MKGSRIHQRMIRRQILRFWTYAIVACLTVAAAVIAGRVLYKEISAPKKPVFREARPKKAALSPEEIGAWRPGRRRGVFSGQTKDWRQVERRDSGEWKRERA